MPGPGLTLTPEKRGCSTSRLFLLLEGDQAAAAYGVDFDLDMQVRVFYDLVMRCDDVIDGIQPVPVE